MTSKDSTNSRIILIGCGQKKSNVTQPAYKLYTGPIATDRISYAIASGQTFYILSGLFGLLTPQGLVEPYNFALSDQPRSYRTKWAAKVVKRLLEIHPLDQHRNVTVEVHAGAPYAEPLIERLKSHTAFADVLWPVKGLSQGHQRQWYKQRRQ